MKANPWTKHADDPHLASNSPQRIRIIKTLWKIEDIRELIDWPGTQPFVRLVGRQRIDQLELQKRPA